MAVKTVVVAVMFGLNCSSLSLAAVAQKTQAAAPVNVIWQNTTDSAVSIYLAVEGQPDELYVSELPAGQQCTLESYPTNRWLLKAKDKQLALYVADENENQEVDVAELSSWQQPVVVEILNTTKDPIDISRINDQGQETSAFRMLPAGKQLSQPTYPGTHWILRQGREIVAEFILDNSPKQLIDARLMIEDYQETVAVSFMNTLKGEVELFWAKPGGGEVSYAKIAPGKEYIQESYPNQLWLVRENGEFRLAYAAAPDIEQSVDIAELSAAVAEVIESR